MRELCVLALEVLTPITVKNSVFWDITTIVRRKSTDVSEKYITSIFRVEESKPSMRQAAIAFLLGLLFDPDDGNDKIL
jgi:hypothetical protein